MPFEFKGANIYERENWGDVFTVLGFSLEHDIAPDLCEPLYEPAMIQRMGQEDLPLAREYITAMAQQPSMRLQSFAAEEAVELIPVDAEFALPLVMAGLSRADAGHDNGIAHYVYNKLTDYPDDFKELSLGDLAALIRAMNTARPEK